MNDSSLNLIDNLYMTWAIAAKDIVEAVRHKTTRMNIVAALGLVMFSTWGAANRFGAGFLFTEVAVYDQGDSQIAALIDSSSEFDSYPAHSPEDLMSLVDLNDVGLVIPEDFDEELNAGGQPTLNGYISWAKRHRTLETELELTQKLSGLLDKPVQVEIGDNLVVPQPDSRGAILDVATTMLLAVFWMAITVMPHVMLEEKQTKTMDALLVSPASEAQVVAGKALVGLFLTLVTAGLALILNANYVTNWGLMLLTFFISSLLAISLALVLGSFIRSAQHLTLWAVPTIVIVVMPAILLQFGDGLPMTINRVLPWIPSAAVVHAFRYAFSNATSMSQYYFSLSIVFVGAAFLYGMVIWKLRRADR